MAKVGILTLPFNGNYGGLIQATCLYRYLSDEGHEVKLLDYRGPSKGSKVKRLLQQVLRKVPYQNFRGQRKIRLFEMYAKEFMPCRTQPCETFHQLDAMCNIEGFDAIVVGSDQVWRWNFIQGRENIFFLDFIKDAHTKKISYGASFGTQHFPSDLHRGSIPEMLKNFNAISVRERSGLDICEKMGRADSKWVLDPTFLVTKSFYEDLAPEIEGAYSMHLFFYILDRSNAKDKVIDAIKKMNGSRNKSKFIDLSSQSSIRNWVEGFRRASFIVTDSYHGAIMSIIFRKPFIAILNEERGADRFNSLLGDFNLSHRGIKTSEINLDVIRILYNEPVDYESIQEKMALRQAESRFFLQQALGSLS